MDTEHQVPSVQTSAVRPMFELIVLVPSAVHRRVIDPTGNPCLGRTYLSVVIRRTVTPQ